MKVIGHGPVDPPQLAEASLFSLNEIQGPYELFRKRAGGVITVTMKPRCLMQAMNMGRSL